MTRTDRHRPIVVVTQARLNSYRLQRKVLLPMCGKPMLWWHLSRLKRARLVDRVVVATTLEPEAEAIVAIAKQLGIDTFKGSERDVLARFHGAAEMTEAGTIVRVTSDCPLIDPALIDHVIQTYLDDPALDYCSLDVSWYPRGLDCEVLTRTALDEMALVATDDYDHEHVTPYIRAHPERFRQIFLRPDAPLPYRWCVDTQEDFARVERLLAAIGTDDLDFSWQELAREAARQSVWEELNTAQ